jgi:two-component system response regulator MprA
LEGNSLKAPPGTTVLVVDDDLDIREAMADALEAEGYRVATASDGLDALRWLRSQPDESVPASLILLDLMMPNMDGVAFRREQVQDGKLQSIPVVLLSADMSVEDKAKAMQAAGYVTKPVELEVLLEVIQRHLSSNGRL